MIIPDPLNILKRYTDRFFWINAWRLMEVIRKINIVDIRSQYRCMVSNKRYSRLKKGLMYWRGEGHRPVVKQLKIDFILGYVFPVDIDIKEYRRILDSREHLKLPAYYSENCLPLVARTINNVELFLNELDSITGNEHVFVMSNVKVSGRLISKPRLLRLESLRSRYVSLTLGKGVQVYIYTPSAPSWTQIFPSGSFISAPVYPGEEEEYRKNLSGLLDGAL